MHSPAPLPRALKAALNPSAPCPAPGPRPPAPGSALPQALLAHAASLSGEQLRSLGGFMAQANMSHELPLLAHAVVPGASSLGREGAGLLAALLSGHTALVQDELRDGGDTALAALQVQGGSGQAAGRPDGRFKCELAGAGVRGCLLACSRGT